MCSLCRDTSVVALTRADESGLASWLNLWRAWFGLAPLRRVVRTAPCPACCGSQAPVSDLVFDPDIY